jgi:hypothetical protein
MTATAATRDRVTGRYAPRPVFTRCEHCGWTLAETLLGGLYCPHRTCAGYRQVVGHVDGVELGMLAEVAE